jgi:hypothetical protein
MQLSRAIKLTSVKGLVTGIRENPIIQEVRNIVFTYGLSTASQAWATGTPLKTEFNSISSDRWAVSAPLVVLFLLQTRINGHTWVFYLMVLFI